MLLNLKKLILNIFLKKETRNKEWTWLCLYVISVDLLAASIEFVIVISNVFFFSKRTQSCCVKKKEYIRKGKNYRSLAWHDLATCHSIRHFLWIYVTEITSSACYFKIAMDYPVQLERWASCVLKKKKKFTKKFDPLFTCKTMILTLLYLTYSEKKKFYLKFQLKASYFLNEDWLKKNFFALGVKRSGFDPP